MYHMTLRTVWVGWAEQGDRCWQTADHDDDDDNSTYREANRAPGQMKSAVT